METQISIHIGYIVFNGGVTTFLPRVYTEFTALFKRIDELSSSQCTKFRVKHFESVFNIHMNYYPLFRVRSWNNGMHCMFLYILIHILTYFDMLFMLFSKFRSGFRPKYSYQSTLLHMIQAWMSAIDNGNRVGAIMIDLSKAFDSLPHVSLIAKLAAYGDWFKVHWLPA